MKLLNKKRLFCLVVIIGLYILHFFWWGKINVSHSLPQKFFVYRVNDKALNRNDIVAFDADNIAGISDGITVFKIVVGLPQEKVIVKNGLVFINNKKVAAINESIAYFGKIHPIEDQIIKPDCYFVVGSNQIFDSYDSRYREFGLICKKSIIGKAYGFF